MEISNVAFVNFTGYLSGSETANRTASISCEYIGSGANVGTCLLTVVFGVGSNVHPCFSMFYLPILSPERLLSTH